MLKLAPSSGGSTRRQDHQEEADMTTKIEQAQSAVSIGELPSWLRADLQLQLNGRPAATAGHPNDNVEQTEDADLIADMLGAKITNQLADGIVLKGDSERAPSLGSELKRPRNDGIYDWHHLRAFTSQEFACSSATYSRDRPKEGPQVTRGPEVIGSGRPEGNALGDVAQRRCDVRRTQ
jgi:hypothetical protein